MCGFSRLEVSSGLWLAMSYGNSTIGRRDGTNQFDRRERQHVKLIAHMRDGTDRDVPTLIEMEDLRKSGRVLYFKKVEVT